MKLLFDPETRKNRSQADPFIFEDKGRYYLYVTGNQGVEAYSSSSLPGPWRYEGIVGVIPGWSGYWAPCIIRVNDTYYMYTSCSHGGMFEYLHVMKADNPLGPFCAPKMLFDCFSIDAHVVRTEAGLFLWYAKDNLTPENGRVGTRIYVDRLLDPYTPAGCPVEAVIPTMDEEIFQRDRFAAGQHWHTIEGAFWFRHDGWQYVMYSGACFENDTYHIGYASARSDEADLTKVRFIKHTDHGAFDPVLIKNDWEEGVGHHSVIEQDGVFYAVYHGRDLIPEEGESENRDRRTARICRLRVKDGIITAERYEDKL